MLPPIPQPINSVNCPDVVYRDPVSVSVPVSESQCILCKTNPISGMPKSALTPYPPSTNHDSRTTIHGQKQTQFKANSNPIKPNFSSKTKLQTQKQTQIKPKIGSEILFENIFEFIDVDFSVFDCSFYDIADVLLDKAAEIQFRTVVRSGERDGIAYIGQVAVHRHVAVLSVRRSGRIDERTGEGAYPYQREQVPVYRHVRRHSGVGRLPCGLSRYRQRHVADDVATGYLDV